jgi:hypothetical protein
MEGDRATLSELYHTSRHRFGLRVITGIEHATAATVLDLPNPIMEQDELFRRLAVALAIGLLIGP